MAPLMLEGGDVEDDADTGCAEQDPGADQGIHAAPGPLVAPAGHQRGRARRRGDLPDLGVPDQLGLFLETVHLPAVFALPGDHLREGFRVRLIPWLTWLTPAIIIIGGPMGFRLTCYYYRKAYYRAFWRAPAACAVREPHAKYTGETRLPLILQNLHRYFFWIALAFNVILSADAVIAFRNHAGQWGHMGLGTLVLIVNAALLWMYSLSCHACRHITGGRLRNFSKHPVRYWMWTQVSRLNARHMQYAWVSLFWVLFTDLYIRLVASGAITDPRFF